ncbi:hypothetical protein AGMMS49965_25720 [Bacteroidia bacterium]|nr:hypothetical protein AGMMS49965_25720 [Bacteroidia bacterium]
MSDKTTYPKEFLAYIQSITNKRAKVVIDHILQHGFITTEDLENTYGYNHPPRAARDVREAGIPLETFKVKSSDGKSIAAYKFGSIDNLQINRIKGRVSFSKAFKRDLYELSTGQCAVCNGNFEERYLQIDHKTPYQVGGDLSDHSLDEFMLLCSSCNRAKSRSCEHCDNWESGKKVDICKQCYWGNPITYSHIAMKDIRRIELQWEGKEVNYYDKMQKNAEKKQTELHEFVKQIIKEKMKG